MKQGGKIKRVGRWSETRRRLSRVVDVGCERDEHSRWQESVNLPSRVPQGQRPERRHGRGVMDYFL